MFDPLPPTVWTRVRTVVNWVNLSTPVGLALAWAGGARLVRRGRGTWIAGGYRWRFPNAPAFTIGSVIVGARDVEALLKRPRVLEHEDRHCTQYAWLGGPIMLVIYVVFVAVSWVLSGDRASFNPLERGAGLSDGGYRARPLRWSKRHEDST